MAFSNELGGRQADDSAGHDESGPLDLHKGVDVVLHYRVDEALVEGVSGSHDNMQARVLNDQRSRPRQRVEEIKRLCFLGTQLLLLKRLRLR
eukprot:2855275-Rhodomonas_salina.6